MWGRFLASHVPHLLALGLTLLASAFFSGSETSLFSLSGGQLHRLGQSGRSGRIVVALMRRSRRTLNMLLLGNMLVNVAFAAVSALLVYDLRDLGASDWTVGLCSAGPLLALILLGEVAPKMIAYDYRRVWATICARALLVSDAILQPLLWIFETLFIWPLTRIIAPRPGRKPHITSQELAALLEISSRRGILDHNANELLQEILELTDLRVRDVMIPRVDMVAYDADGPREGLKKLFLRTRLRRIPIYKKDLDHIIGVVNAKQLLLGEPGPLRKLANKPLFVPEAANLEQVLRQFQTRQTQTAIAVDEYGGTSGLVTLRDVVEQIVGDVPDAYEAPQAAPVVQRMDDGTYLVDGNLPVREWAEAIGVDLSAKRVSTIGGFVTSLLGRIPVEGESVEFENLRFTVETMRARRIGKLRIELREDRR